MLSSVNRFLKAYNFALQKLNKPTRVHSEVMAYVTQCITAIKPAVKKTRGAKNTIGDMSHAIYSCMECVMLLLIALDEFKLNHQYFNCVDMENVKECCWITLTRFIKFHEQQSAHLGNFLQVDDCKSGGTPFFSIRQRGWLSAYVFTYLLFSLGAAGYYAIPHFISH